VDGASARPGALAIDLLGKAWASPTTLIGLILGLVGHVAGWAMRRRVRISLGNNAVQFEGNAVAGISAVTFGNVCLYRGPICDAAHERQHTYQAQLLGPFYLPSNFAGGVAALLLDGFWHGPHNWNETGPLMSPSRPWPGSRPR